MSLIIILSKNVQLVKCSRKSFALPKLVILMNLPKWVHDRCRILGRRCSLFWSYRYEILTFVERKTGREGQTVNKYEWIFKIYHSRINKGSSFNLIIAKNDIVWICLIFMTQWRSYILLLRLQVYAVYGKHWAATYKCNLPNIITSPK